MVNRNHIKCFTNQKPYHLNCMCVHSFLFQWDFRNIIKKWFAECFFFSRLLKCEIYSQKSAVRGDLHYGRLVNFFRRHSIRCDRYVVFVVELSESLKTTWIYKTEKITACQLFFLKKNSKYIRKKCTRANFLLFSFALFNGFGVAVSNVRITKSECIDHVDADADASHTFAFKLYCNNPLISVFVQYRFCCIDEFVSIGSTIDSDQNAYITFKPKNSILITLYAYENKKGVHFFSLYALFIRQYTHWEMIQSIWCSVECNNFLMDVTL